MKITYRPKQELMAMANLQGRRTSLSVNIWSDGQGCLRNKPDVTPRVKIGFGNESVSVSISADPKVLAPKSWRRTFKKSTVKAIEEGIDYVSRNYDLFLSHYEDTDGSFDDYELFESLKRRGEFK